MKNPLHFITQVARSIFFDNSSNGFSSNNVQNAIEEIGSSASPGFSFGREGSSGAGTWLRRVGNIESNRTGVPVPIASPRLVKIACGTENIATYSVGIYQHEGNSVNLTLLTTVSVVSSRFQTFNVNVAAAEGKQIAARCTATSGGNPKNLGVDIVIKGSAV